VLPLLDGLDEVARAHRAGCVEAINAFRDQHGLLPMAVCSRVGDYQELGAQVRLQEAILVQPLTRAQVTTYLKKAGRPLAGVRAALREDPQLWELLESPLLLSIVTLTYQGMPAAAVRAMGSAEDRRRHLFAGYVDRMLQRRARSRSPTPPAQTLRWLGWLARSMRDRSQSVFYLEQLQPDWLPGRQRWLVTTGPALALGIATALIAFPFVSYSSLVAGLAIGILAWGRTIRPVEHIRWSRRRYGRRFLVRFGWGLLPGVAYGSLFAFNQAYTEEGVPIPFDLTTALTEILGSALTIGLITGVIGGFLPRGISPRQSVPNEGIRRSARRVRSIFLFALVLVFIWAAFFLWLSSSSPSISMPSSNLVTLLIGALLLLSIYMVLLLPILLWAGGKASLQHLVLRRLLVRNKAAPWRYVEFLDEATDRLLLRKVGGGYVFVHRLLLDYFADLQKGEVAEMTPRTADVSPAH
jgi:hypothetical protein